MEDPKAIAASVKALESSLTSVGVKLAIATGAVVFGLVVEYWDDARKAFFALVNCIRFRRLSDWNALDRHVRTAVIGGLFITIGVGAELRYEHVVNVLEGQLETENGLLFANLNDKASAADERSKQLQADADTQRGITAGALQKAGEANATAEDERGKRVRLEAAINPRNLSLDQQRKLQVSCPARTGKKITVLTYVMDVEGAGIATQVASALDGKSAVRPVIGNSMVSGVAPRQGIMLSSTAEDKPVADCLMRWFSVVGKLGKVSRFPIDRIPGTPITIEVGVKPYEILTIKK
jgi:hypothetical protein